MIDTRFFDLIRGALIAAPTSEVPVMKIPQAAPRTDNVSAAVIPADEYMYGDPNHSQVVLGVTTDVELVISRFFGTVETSELQSAQHSSFSLLWSFGIYNAEQRMLLSTRAIVTVSRSDVMRRSSDYSKEYIRNIFAKSPIHDRQPASNLGGQ